MILLAEWLGLHVVQFSYPGCINTLLWKKWNRITFPGFAFLFVGGISLKYVVGGTLVLFLLLVFIRLVQ